MPVRLKRLFGVTALALLACRLSAARPAGQSVEEVPMTLQTFSLSDVRLGEGPCLVAQEANRRYLHMLDSDRLLYSFRQNAGLPAPGRPLGGWEKPEVEVRGHFLGHYLSACALMYASTGDDELRAKADRIVAELAECQDKLGGGYLAAYPESYLDRLETMDRVTWAPLYVIHKIMAGLLDMYQLAGNRQALEMLQKMSAYFKRRADKLSDYQFERMLTVEFGGMSEVLHNLYGITGNPDHLALANRYDQAAFLGPLALGRDNLTGLHGNTQIPKICGAARRYELTGEKIYRRITEFFWDRVVHTRCYATGGTTSGEHWPEPNALAHTLSGSNQECCKTHNMLKVTRYLIRWTGDAAYADYYERAFFNGILGTQRPTDGMLMYYVPLACGLTKRFGTPYDSFWCCYGTGIESFAKLGDSIYFHDDEAVYVNLFIASTVRWKEQGLRLEQVTRFPEEEGTTLVFHLDRPTRMGLRIHVPYWATRGVTVSVNGEPVQVDAKPTSYARIERKWSDGDRVEVSLPMSLHAAPMPDDEEMVAVMYGPLVLAGLSPDPEGFILGDPQHPEEWVEKLPGQPLTFQTRGQTTTMRLIPLNRVLDQPYGVYWVVTQEGSPRHKAILAERERRRRREARVVDRVIVGDRESERAHGLRGEKMSDGAFGNHHWRHAANGGWWSWELKVLSDQPMTLTCTYWGSDAGKRKFDLLIDDVRIATQELNRNDPGRFFDVDYAIPPDLTRGKDKVTVRFQAHPGHTAGGAFGCAILRPER